MGAERRANTVDATELSGRLELGRVNLNTLLGNEGVRGELQETAKRAIRAQLDGPRPPPVPSTVTRSFVQTLDARTAAAFRQRGVAALGSQERDALAALLANARLQELRGFADQKGYIPSARAAQVFHWIDNFDRNGSARTFDIFTPESAAAAQPQLTDAGRVYKRILESTETDVQFTEDEFVAGFMNGAFSPERFRALRPEQVEALRRAGIYDQLTARLKDSQLPQELSPEALSRMFRRIDTVDTDGDGKTMTARGPGAAAQRETPFPLQSRATPDAEQNQTYRTMRVLRDLFDQRAAPERGQARVDTLVPPPANDLTESPLRSGRDKPLASRTAIDLDTFSNYVRDARINLATIEREDPAAWRQLTEAFAAAGVSGDDLRRLAANDVIGGSSDRDASGAAMQRLHALLASNRFGGQRGVIKPWVNGPDSQRTIAGRVLEVLDRHLERFNLTTRQDLARDLAAGRLQPARLNNEIDTPNGRRRVSDLLREARVDLEQLTRNGRSSADLASYLYETLGAQEANRAPGMRPNTLNLGNSRNGQTVETQAGRVIGLIRRHLLQGYDQQFRAYTNAAPNGEQALFDSSVQPVRIATHFSGYRDGDPAGCFRRAAETIASSGVARTSPSGGTNHYLANGSDNVLGAIRAEARHLEQGRMFIDGMLNQGLPVQIAVMRRGSPDAAAGNPGSGVRHSLVIDQRGVEYGRVFYEGWDNATGSRENGRIRFYVDPRTNLLYAPANPSGPVYLSQGGYQVSLVKVPVWVRTRTQLPGTRSDGRGGFVVNDPDAFFHHFTQADIQGPMIAAPVQRERRVQVAQR